MGDEWNATHGLHARGAQGAHDFVLVAIDVRAAREERLAAGNRLAGRRCVTWNSDFLLDEALVAGKIECVNFEQTGFGIEEREAGVVMVNDALESLDDAPEEFRNFTAGDQDVVDFEKNLEAVALARELRLIGLGSLKIEGVIDCDGDLAGDALHELRVTSFQFGIGNDVRLLGLPDPAGRMALHGMFDFRRFWFRGGDARLEDVQAHDVLDGVVKDEGEEIEIDDGVETLGKVVEQRGEIALLGDGLADFEQGFELTPGMFKRGGERHFRRGDDGFRHRRQDNTRVGEGSTADGRELVRSRASGEFIQVIVARSKTGVWRVPVAMRCWMVSMD